MERKQDCALEFRTEAVKLMYWSKGLRAVARRGGAASEHPEGDLGELDGGNSGEGSR